MLQRVRGVQGIVAGVITSGSTPVNSAAIDRLGADGAMARSALIILNHGAQKVGTVTLAPLIQEGETSSPVTPVTLKTLLPTAIACTAVGSSYFHVDLEGFARYFRVVVTPTPTASGVVDLSLDVVLGDMDLNPEASPAVVYAK